MHRSQVFILLFLSLKPDSVSPWPPSGTDARASTALPTRPPLTWLSGKVCVELSRWCRHRRWPRLHDARAKCACSTAAALGFALLIFRFNRHRSHGPLDKHALCLSSLSMCSVATVLHKPRTGAKKSLIISAAVHLTRSSQKHYLSFYLGDFVEYNIFIYKIVARTVEREPVSLWQKRSFEPLSLGEK